MRRDMAHGRGERGATLVEFTIGALVFLTAIFGVLEFSRLLFTHNALSDSVRRAARYAVSAAARDADTSADDDSRTDTGPAADAHADAAPVQTRREHLDGLRLPAADEGEQGRQVPVTE